MKQQLKTFVKLSVCASAIMYLINKFIESDATIHHLLKTSSGDYYDWRYGKIYYTKQGSGTPVLLIHDLNPSSSQQEWSEIIKTLSNDHTIYAIDLLGCGRSDKPFITYTNYLYAQLLRDFCKDVIGETVEIMATGKSCPLIIAAAKLSPELFKKLTLVNPESLRRAAVSPTIKSKLIKAILDCPIIGVSLYYLLTSKNQQEYHFSETYFYNPFRSTVQMITTYYESAHLSGGNGRHLQASISGCYVNFDIRYALHTIKQPVHLIFGEQLERARSIAISYRKVNHTVFCSYIHHAKMLPQLEAPEKFLSCI